MRHSKLSNLRTRSLLAIPLTVATLFAAATCSPTAQTETPWTVLTAQQLTRTLYPELDGKSYFMSVRFGGTYDANWTRVPPFDLQVWKVDPGHQVHVQNTPAPNHQQPEEPLLGAYFMFDPDGGIQSVHFVGASTTLDRKNRALQNLVQSHREWTSGQAFRALKSAGAKYGPDDIEEFRKAIPIAQLEEFLGKLSVRSVEFHGLAEKHVGWFVLLNWEVDVEAQRPGGLASTYALTFEPFDGRLIMLGKSPFLPSSEN
jgi:hypothetical protein